MMLIRGSSLVSRMPIWAEVGGSWSSLVDMVTSKQGSEVALHNTRIARAIASVSMIVNCKIFVSHCIRIPHDLSSRTSRKWHTV